MTVVKVAINKRHRRSRLGLKFGHQDKSSPLTISKISEGGLFDETPLVQGLVVLQINDEDVTWMSPKKADSILRKTKKGRITITAEGFVGKIVRQSRDEKIGIVLHKPMDSCDDIFIWQIKGHSKFAGTDLKPGMKIITINGFQCPSSPTEAIRLMQRTIGKLKIVAVEVNRPQPQPTSSMQIRVAVNAHMAAGSAQEETSQAEGYAKETVSIVPSSITSVSGFSTLSSKDSIRERVKAVLKPLLKDERSVETEEMTDSSSTESREKYSRKNFRKKSKMRVFRKTKPQHVINIESHGDIPDLEDPVIEDRDGTQGTKIKKNPTTNQDHSDATYSSSYIPLVECESYKMEELKALEKHSHTNSLKKSKRIHFRKTKQEQEINNDSNRDIPDSEDKAIEDGKEVRSSKIEALNESARDHSKTTPSSDFIPLIDGEPFEELISATKQIIHYLGDKITINAERESTETLSEHLTFLSFVPVADDKAQTSLPVTDDNTKTSLPIVDDIPKTSLSIVDDNANTNLSNTDENASLFGEDISLPPDLGEAEVVPSDEDSPSKNQAKSTEVVSPPKNPLPVAYAKLLQPKYPSPTRSSRAKHSSSNNDNPQEPLPLKLEQGFLQDIGGTRLQSQISEEDEIIEEIEGEEIEREEKEGDSSDVDRNVSVTFKLDPPHIHHNLQFEKRSIPRSEGLVKARDPEIAKQRGIDPSEGDARKWSQPEIKKLEPPGFRAGVKEPKGGRGRDPEIKSSSQESRHDRKMRQEEPGTARLQKRPVHSKQSNHDGWVSEEQPEVVRLQKPPVRPSSHAGCSFVPQEGLIPQEVWSEMHSDFNSFWDRQKSFVESSWASLVGVV